MGGEPMVMLGDLGGKGGDRLGDGLDGGALQFPVPQVDVVRR